VEIAEYYWKGAGTTYNLMRLIISGSPNIKAAFQKYDEKFIEKIMKLRRD